MLPERPFGETGHSFPEIGFGAWSVAGAEHGTSYDPVDDQESLAAIQRALELGVEVFDTADVYGHGHSEEVLGKALGDQGVVFTNVGFDLHSDPPGERWEAAYIQEALERSLARLGRDRVTLLQLHNPPRGLLEDGTVYGLLEELGATGLTELVGLSVHTGQECLALARSGADVVDAVQVPVSVLRQDTLTGIAELAEAGIAVVAREPLANGSLPQEAIDVLAEHGIHDPVGGALAFVLAHEVSLVIPGAKTAEQVEHNVQAPETIGRMPSVCLQSLYDLWDRWQASGDG